MREPVCRHCGAPLLPHEMLCGFCAEPAPSLSFLGSSWVMVAFCGLIVLLLTIITIDGYANLGMMKWIGDQVAPKDRRPWAERVLDTEKAKQR